MAAERERTGIDSKWAKSDTDPAAVVAAVERNRCRYAAVAEHTTAEEVAGTAAAEIAESWTEGDSAAAVGMAVAAVVDLVGIDIESEKAAAVDTNLVERSLLWKFVSSSSRLQRFCADAQKKRDEEEEGKARRTRLRISLIEILGQLLKSAPSRALSARPSTQTTDRSIPSLRRISDTRIQIVRPDCRAGSSELVGVVRLFRRRLGVLQLTWRVGRSGVRLKLRGRGFGV